MTARDFTLEPFRGSPAVVIPDCRVSGRCHRSGQVLTIRYELQGDLSQLTLATPAACPERRMGLWEATCFEFFLAPAGSPGYWEFNLSPAGHWNVFRFAGYRQGRRDEEAFTVLPFRVEMTPQCLLLELTANLGFPELESAPTWRLGISTVLLSRETSPTYWALAHPGPEADFHHPKGFLIDL